MVNMALSKTFFRRCSSAALLCNSFVQFSVWGEVVGDGGTQVSEVLHRLESVVVDGDAWDVADVLAKDVGLFVTDVETKIAASECKGDNESL